MKDEKKGQLGQCESLIFEKKTIEYIDVNMENEQLDLPKLLLHSCCGPCSTSVIERLINDYSIKVFFYNPNIVDEEEYNKRKEAQIKVIEEFAKRNTRGNISLMEDIYLPKVFHNEINGFEDEPEGGKRCNICFRLRLEETASKASMYNFDTFGTTLTVSPHKDYNTISKLGNMLSAKYKVGFLDQDFKKRDGFKRSIEMSKQLDLYRQNFCGCKYSIWEK